MSRGPACITTPTPGPAGSSLVQGHVLVVLALLVRHKSWGTTALPLLSRLDIRREDLPAIAEGHRPAFRTEREMAVELLRWAKPWLELLKLPIWVVADGAYATEEVLRPARAPGMTVVGRLRRDAALWSRPGPKPPGRRGPAPTYGKDAVDPAKRAGQRRGWSTGTFGLYGQDAVKRSETFVATWKPAGGMIRVVLVDEPSGWRAHFCTDPDASVADILGLVADRFSLGITSREVKRVVGGGAAAGAVPVGQRRGVPPLPAGLHDDRGVGRAEEG